MIYWNMIASLDYSKISHQQRIFPKIKFWFPLSDKCQSKVEINFRLDQRNIQQWLGLMFVVYVALIQHLNILLWKMRTAKIKLSLVMNSTKIQVQQLKLTKKEQMLTFISWKTLFITQIVDLWCLKAIGKLTWVAFTFFYVFEGKAPVVAMFSSWFIEITNREECFSDTMKYSHDKGFCGSSVSWLTPLRWRLLYQWIRIKVSMIVRADHRCQSQLTLSSSDQWPPHHETPWDTWRTMITTNHDQQQWRVSASSYNSSGVFTFSWSIFISWVVESNLRVVWYGITCVLSGICLQI